MYSSDYTDVIVDSYHCLDESSYSGVTSMRYSVCKFKDDENPSERADCKIHWSL